MAELVTEAGPVIAGSPDSGGRIKVTIITPGWGSSGYYSPEVLEQAGRDGVFHAGLHMFVDHPTQREQNDKPERSVKELAAVLVEAASWDPAAQELTATAQLLGPHAETFRQPEMAKAIGVSIRASADVTMGEAEGRRGRIVGTLVEAQSVDFVTRAGRGGRYQVIESATPSRVVRRAVDHGVAEATANDLREWLSDALKDAYGAEKSWVWVRDFDDSTVWYEHETPDATGLFQHSYSENDGSVTLAGNPVEVRVETRYVPVDPAADTTTQESLEDTMPQIEEARLGQLEEAASRVPALESERDQHKSRADLAESKLQLIEARDAARPGVAAKVAESKTLGARTQTRVVESVLAQLPMKNGALDADALPAVIESAVAAAEAEVADYAPTAPTSLFGTFGSVTESQGQTAELSESDIDADVAAAFGRKVSN